MRAGRREPAPVADPGAQEKLISLDQINQQARHRSSTFVASAQPAKQAAEFSLDRIKIMARVSFERPHEKIDGTEADRFTTKKFAQDSFHIVALHRFFGNFPANNNTEPCVTTGIRHVMQRKHVTDNSFAEIKNG